jgi:hypothetical protein
MRIILVYNEMIFINSLHQKISALKRAEFVNNTMPYTVLRGCWCDIIGLNLHTPTEDKNNDSKVGFCEELGQVYDHFPMYRSFRF